MRTTYSIVLTILSIIVLLTACVTRDDMFNMANLRSADDSIVLVDVWASSNTGLRVTFNKDVDKTSAEIASHYSITGLNILSANRNAADNSIV
ncbi:MAG: hypothetical protein ACW99Q_27950, partial [Candidatus Kariarchaeaceae archaeon]